MNKQTVFRSQIEDFLYHEATLLDEWRLDEWLELLTEDVIYEIPSTDAPNSTAKSALFLIADDATRIRARVKRLNDTQAHAEFPRSRTRRLITNVRITEQTANEFSVTANFAVYRYRRNASLRQYVGRYFYRLRLANEQLLICERRAVLDTNELGLLGAVSFIL